MPQDHDREFGFAAMDDDAAQSLREAIHPPPPMPSAAPAPPVAAGSVSQSAQALPAPGTPATTTSAPATQPAPTTGGWKVDTRHLEEFSWAVERARDRLSVVRMKVEEIQSSAYTPKLGTSPVGAQLEKKFTDRVDAPLDDPQHPTSGGLRPMLAEAMRRMDEFVRSAEAAARSYTEHDEGTGQTINTSGSNETKPKI